MRLYGAVSMRSASMMGWALLFVQSLTLLYVTYDPCSERKLNKLICLTTLDFGEIMDFGLSLEHTWMTRYSLCPPGKMNTAGK